MKRTNKKGFTIVELVIVIAVIAILAAVLIPNISKLVRKANESSDLSLVRNLNTALSLENKDYATAHEAFEAVKEAGYDLTKIEAKADENKILYDSENKCFVYLKGDKLEYYPNSKKVDLTTADYYKLWMVCSTIDDNDGTYSIYWNGGDVTETINVENVGFDAANASVAGMSYTGNKGNSVVIRTNGGKLTVDAKTDTVSHYGNASEVYVKNVDKASYHENGTTGILTVEYGHVEMGEAGKVSTMVVAPAAANDVTVTATKKDQIESIVGKGENATSIVESVSNATGATTVDYQDSSAFDNADFFNAGGYALKGAYIVLDKDVTKASNSFSVNNYLGDKKIIIDLNGHALTIKAFNIKQGGELVILDSVGTGSMNFAYWNGIDIDLGGVLTLNSGTIYASSFDSNFSVDDLTAYGSAVFMRSGSSFIMNGGKIVSNNTKYTVGSLAVRMFQGDTKFVMNGGEIEKTAGMIGAIMASGSGSSGTTIEINGGSIKSNTVAIYHPQSGSLTVNGGYIEGTTAIYIKCGSIALNGGEIKATATEASDYQYYGNGCYPTGDAVVIDACNYPDKNPVVKIAGGTYTVTASGAHGIAHYQYNGNTAIITNTAGVEIFEKAVLADGE